MRKSLCVTICLIAFLSSWVSAQPPTRPNISDRQILELKNDSVKVKLLLQAAMHQIKKPDEFKADLDSAAAYIAQARNINATLKSMACDGDIAFTEANLYEDRRQDQAGRRSAEMAIQYYLKAGKHDEELADAYRELFLFCSCDNYGEKAAAVSNAIRYYHKVGDADEEAEVKGWAEGSAHTEAVFLQTAKQAQQWRMQLGQETNDSSRAELLMKLANFEIKKPGEFKADLDTAADLIGRVEQLNVRLNSLRLSGLIALNASLLSHERIRYDESKAFAEKAIGIFERLGQHYALLGDAYMQIAAFYSEISVTETRDSVLKALYYYRLAGDSVSGVLQILNCDRVMWEIENANGNIHEALFYALEGIKYVDSTHAAMWFPYFCYRLTELYSIAGLYDESIHWAEQAIDFFAKNGNHSNVDYYNVILYYAFGLQEEDKIKEELNLIEKTIHDFPPANTNQRRVADEILGRTYLWLNQKARGEAYYKELEKLYKNYPQEHRRKDDGYYLNLALHDYKMARFYDQDQNYQKAANYLTAYDTTIRRLPKWAPYITYQVEQVRYQVDSGLHNYAAALRDFQHATSIKDSLFNEAKTRQISDLTIKYQTTEKDNNIKLLHSQGDRQQAELQKISWQRNLTTVGVVLLIIIASLAFKAYRLKQRTNKQLDKLLLEKEDLLADKEVLMKEIHHRVKNNLHMISSLLESQSAYLEKEALQAVQKSQHRVQAISLIHQRLYMGGNITVVDMPSYLREIINYLKDFIADKHIRFSLDLDPVKLDVGQAVPVGLIVNEGITNAMKYAFPNDRTGSIEVRLKRIDESKCLLRIADNGVGLPGNFDKVKPYSLGMSLIRGLSKNLHGSVAITSAQGTAIELLFSLTGEQTEAVPAPIGRTKIRSIV